MAFSADYNHVLCSFPRMTTRRRVSTVRLAELAQRGPLVGTVGRKQQRTDQTNHSYQESHAKLKRDPLLKDGEEGEKKDGDPPSGGPEVPSGHDESLIQAADALCAILFSLQNSVSPRQAD